MTPHRKAQLVRIRKWILTPTAALSALGIIGAQVDARYVHASIYDRKTLIDSTARLAQRKQDSLQLARLTEKVDSANVRLQQIICGRRVDEGCR
ncbi:MAG TPA: hypothetical protein VIP11_07565 [Gemmatimonadaceae bacterium]